MIRTESLPYLFDSVSKGQTIFLFCLSKLDESFPDLIVSLPSLEEFEAARVLVTNHPEIETAIEDILCRKHVLFEPHLLWLQSEAPAGLMSSLCTALILLGCPPDIKEVNTALDLAREQTTYHTELKRFLVSSGRFSVQDLIGLDFLKLVALVTTVESSLIELGQMEQKLKFTPPKASKKGQAQTGIDFEEENKRIAHLMQSKDTREDYEWHSLRNRDSRSGTPPQRRPQRR